MVIIAKLTNKLRVVERLSEIRIKGRIRDTWT